MSHPDRGRVLDNPYVHRALELCMLIIHNFLYAHNCYEMILELTHRRLKSWLEVNSHPDSHLTGMERVMESDWLGRLYVLFQTWKKGETTEKNCAERLLRLLLIGVEGVHVDEGTRPGRDLLHELRDILDDAFREPVLGMIEDCGQVNLP